MSSPTRRTPSGVLRDALQEYSRERRRRNRERRNRSRENIPETEERDDRQSFHDEQEPSVDVTLIHELLPDKGAAASATASDVTFTPPVTLLEITPPPQVEAPYNQTEVDSDEEIDQALELAVEAAAASNPPDESVSDLFYDFDNAQTFDSESPEDIMTGFDCLFCCFKSRRYYVPPQLRDGDAPVQTHFIQKVFAVLLVKSIIVIAWLKILDLLNPFREFYEDTFQYHAISGGMYLLIKAAIRLTKHFRKEWCLIHVVLHMIDIVAACDFLGCTVSHWLSDYSIVPRKVLFTMAAVSAFYIFVGFFVTYDMRDGIMLGSAVIITAVTSLHQVLHERTKLIGSEPHAGRVAEEVICFLAVLTFSEILILIIMFELRSVLTGRRFSPTSSDWFFTAVYIV